MTRESSCKRPFCSQDTHHCSCPYEKGEIIDLHLLRPHDPQQPREIEATIIRLFKPFTLSCAMIVQINDHPKLASEGKMVLKLFDRRFVTEFWQMWNVDVWTPDTENEFHQFVNDSCSSRFLADVKADKELMCPRAVTLSAAQSEAWMNQVMMDLYETEVKAYVTLSDVQGDVVPRLIGLVTASSSRSVSPGPLNQSTAIPGILFQYIRGFPLKDLARHAPKELWDGICYDAMQLLRVTGEHGILNQDVQPRNVIVKKFRADHYKPFMIDFAICRFREEAKDEEEWRRWRVEEDEEGELGRAMENHLDVDYVYRRSRYSEQLRDK